MDRRGLLSSLGAGILVFTAGCGQPQGSDRTQQSQSPQRTQTLTETATPEEPKLNLPDDPLTEIGTTFGIQDVVTAFEGDYEGFDGSADEYEFETEPQASFDGSGVEISDARINKEISPDAVGTGQASGFAAGSYQTAWQAPAEGRYQLSARYSRHADILYDKPNRGNISASFDTSLLAIRHDDAEVIADVTHPEFQHKNGGLQEELAEFVISTGISTVVGTAFGLGLVARVILGRIVNNLIDLSQQVGSHESDIYDIYHRVEPNYRDPSTIGLEFEANAGETLIFELAPTLGVGFEIVDSWWYQPTLNGSFEFDAFGIDYA
jgi:hypothetical protein